MFMIGARRVRRGELGEARLTRPATLGERRRGQRPAPTPLGSQTSAGKLLCSCPAVSIDRLVLVIPHMRWQLETPPPDQKSRSRTHHPFLVREVAHPQHLPLFVRYLPLARSLRIVATTVGTLGCIPELTLHD
ncbi:hypothetical protein ACLB2K_015843 [Fragaria x ananassa]